MICDEAKLVMLVAVGVVTAAAAVVVVVVVVVVVEAWRLELTRRSP